MGIINVGRASPTARVNNIKKAPPKKRRLAPVRKKRLVRFKASNVFAEVPTSNLAEKPHLWWTKEERKDILRNNLRLAQSYKRNNRQSVQHCNEVFEQCCDDSDDSEHDDDDSIDGKISSWLPQLQLPGHVRGLEWGFCARPKNYRKNHVQRVLSLQSDLPDSDSKMMLLSTRAIQSSKPSRALARIMGEGDAEATKEPKTFKRPRCRMIPSWW